MRFVSIAAAALMSLGAGVWVMSTDEVAAFAAVIGIHEVRTVKTARPAVALLVRAPAGEAVTVARRLGRDHLQASIATTTAPSAAAIPVLAAYGDVPIPAIGRAGFFGWIHTSSALRREARALHLHHHFYYLEPHDPSLGQLLLARTAGGLPVRGSIVFGERTQLPDRPLRAGDVVVVTLSGSPATLRSLERLARALQSRGLIALPLSAFTG
jgi:hypothetical protein